MILTDQNSAINSLNESLVPDPYLIDGRTEQDWLHFLTEFSKLINFYNDKNKIEGNWNPFLLKDPVFLMASISKTNYKNLHSSYKNSCSEIKRLIQNETNSQSNALNKLFDHITSVYKIIERWTHYLLSNNESYDLKTYIINEVKNRLSIDFWAIQSFRNYLYKLSFNGIFIVPSPQQDFDSFDKNIWNINKDKSPFWEVFGFETEQNILQAKDKMTTFCLDILTKIGDKLFHFLETIIHHSGKEFKKLSLKKGHFPDTTLLRSFVNILQLQQNQLNKISEKHLDFYYKDILKQTKLPAIPDNAYLCATLAKNDSVFTLPSGTLFSAGIDAQKNPVLFASQKNVNLNPAVIKSVQTLTYQNQPNTNSFNLQTISKPTSIQLDQDNKAISWETFGTTTPSVNALPVGISFASPMLLLREGQRTITLTLEFDSAVDLQLLQNATYFLSTQKNWLKLVVLPTDFQLNASLPNTVIITLNIDPVQPSIEPFLINPDGISSDWPMMKILFQTISNPNTPPKIVNLTIEVKIKGIKTFQLYNDFGELNTKNPFPPFGPIPVANANFIIGNNEIFSKPLDSLLIEIDWDKRPADFENYYSAYNHYLFVLNNPTKQNSFVSEVEDKIKNIFHKKVVLPNPDVPFSNKAFTANFNIMQGKSWQGLTMTKIENTANDSVFVPTSEVSSPVYLFGQEKPDPKQPILSTSSSLYIYYKTNTSQIATIPFLADPNIQKEPLKFTDTSSSGFLKMTLSGCEYGFGSELYPNVVANIALQNGNKLAMAKDKEVTDFVASANLPFAPKIKTFTGTYSASVTYKLDGTNPDYPFQYFLYSPFSTYSLFDSITIDSTATVINTTITGVSATSITTGFPLYPSFNYTGALFIELTNLICNSSINLYFELARNTTAITTEDSVQYYYLTKNGWNEIKPLSDETDQFRCSGIIALPIPADCGNNAMFMPGTNNWIAVTVTGKPESYSKTTFLQANGFSVERTGTAFLSNTEKPEIAATTITKPETKISQIATIIQPFASFGGKAAENKTDRNRRVSNSIKTKNRASSPADYFTLIAENFNDVYYSKVVTKNSDNSCNVYLVKKAKENDANAFIPLVDNSLEIKVEQFLKQNSSPFINLNVNNFNLEYVCIATKISIKSGYQETLIQKNVNLALKLYLSPWITDCPSQIEIDKPLTNAKVSSFIQNIEGVATVENVYFSSYYINSTTGLQTSLKQNKETLKPHGPITLLVSSPNHDITFLS
ncbi:hypothetical protein KHA90_11360 [Flavobacterium psychroterrae]|uniref:Baseplate protein J-like domain-containing protein n=1 Tax=Flavobacterium psychroterrae TaxID=2133767 RepID=A0ABS5PBE7_9FLAO|nr:hypothetical protein [Flavobacterium psychroterrae]MBS7231622.1 hypothetical protein [Flavobacterium psychroterrae]